MCLSHSHVSQSPLLSPIILGGETTEKPDGGWCLEIWESWVLQFYQRWQWDEWLLVVVVSGAWHQRCPDSNLGFSLAHACPILASDWPSEWPGDHPWPRSSPVSGHSPCSEAHEAPPDTALHIARTCSTKYCPWSTGSLAGIINHIIPRNETCAFGVSTGACQSMSLVYFLPNLHGGKITAKPGVKDAYCQWVEPKNHKNPPPCPIVIGRGNYFSLLFVTLRYQLSNWVMVKFLNQDTNCNNKYGPFWDMWHGDW